MFNSLPYGLPSYIFSPNWFYGIDSLIEIIATFVCVLLVFYSYKCYKLTSERRYAYFSISFISLTIAFVSKVIGTIAIYSPEIKETTIGYVGAGILNILGLTVINPLSWLLYIFFTIMGFMMLFLIVSKLQCKDKRVIAMLLYLVFIASWLGIVHYQLFYLTTFVMLGLIAYSYITNYKEIKSKNSLLVSISFSILFLSHAFFVFAIYSKSLYVIAQMIQLLGFLCLLIPFMLIFIKKPSKQNLVK